MKNLEKNANARLTIYLGGPQRRRLLEWAKDFTRAASDSEAIFSALEILRNEFVQKHKQTRASAFKKIKGIWANNSRIEQAFKEVEKGWANWGSPLR